MLDIQNISFSYTESPVIKNISFSIEKGQNIAIIGESGCGKSTLLKLIYGLYDLDEGKIFYGDKPVLGPKFNLIPGMPYMKYLAQDFDLSPYETVAENVGKFLSNGFANMKKLRVQELLEMVEMEQFSNVKTKFLSGGQQQRVALVRVLALEPEVILLDEPFSQIDAFRKNALRRNLFRYLKQKGITCIIATHDSTDALSFADQAIVMRNGEVLVKDDPAKIYEDPKIKYVASLFGEVNEIPTHLLLSYEDETHKTLVYPHQFKMVSESKLMVKIRRTYFRGSHYLIETVYKRQLIFFESEIDLPLEQEVFLALNYL
ncbi:MULTISPECIES: ABC transporter ATP-binding protein [Flavobacterium]|jgi:ABC-type Fe3+/spermidine/putrescine transport system ATPase subunit|uniref:ABC transporter-like protein n=1 Tax=Flavobacterium anhuiense TaxID=459526 RepID=A0A1G5JDT3_9FLAO|nr:MULTISPECIES: ABC transporter ATP-binding protein [Flavobacterium]AOC95378.1 Fe(3+) ions import ATP-binding protein FbpC 2 [Flavobacterium anhuiense]EJG01952.1 ABC transporter-like protein [Flavobacterium sp. F52]MXO06075.1 ATP-binding cassette domain-containing protein [Flavobacterium sp. HBTb2-11-1]RYJ36608.1 ABC transporter-like protein [Flavobacterium anhuiense]SCY85959.1 ABC-type Fe3+/spermidine/putrescine transport systems, ATPase components [Flavobacterium anhuiense]